MVLREGLQACEELAVPEGRLTLLTVEKAGNDRAVDACACGEEVQDMRSNAFHELPQEHVVNPVW